MDVNTADLGNLAAEVAALSRKVSALTGRTTVMGNHLGRLDGLVDDVVRWMAVTSPVPPPPRAAPRHARPRHLHVVGSGPPPRRASP